MTTWTLSAASATRRASAAQRCTAAARSRSRSKGNRSESHQMSGVYKSQSPMLSAVRRIQRSSGCGWLELARMTAPCKRTNSPAPLQARNMEKKLGRCRCGRVGVTGSLLSGQAAIVGHRRGARRMTPRSEEHTSELQSQFHLVCRLLLEKKNRNTSSMRRTDTLHGDADCVIG